MNNRPRDLFAELSLFVGLTKHQGNPDHSHGKINFQNEKSSSSLVSTRIGHCEASELPYRIVTINFQDHLA